MIGLVAVLLAVLVACGDKDSSVSPVGEWQLSRINNRRDESSPPKLLTFHANGTFDGWFYNSDGLYEGTGTWSVAGAGEHRSLTLKINSRDGSIGFEKTIYWGSKLVDEWHPPYDKTTYERVK